MFLNDTGACLCMAVILFFTLDHLRQGSQDREALVVNDASTSPHLQSITFSTSRKVEM